MAKKILIIRLSSLGDVVLTTPIVRSLKKRFPNSEIDFLVKPQYADVIRYNPYLSNIYNYSDIGNIITKLKQSRYDLIIDLQNNLRSKKVTYHLKSNVYRFKKPIIKKFLLVNFKINLFNETTTIVERYTRVIPGLKLDDEGLEIYIPEEIIKESNNFFNEKTSVIGLCPGSRHFTKRWLAEYFIELGIKLSNDGHKIFIFGGSSDKEICTLISNKIPGSINLQNNNEILKIAAYMKKCKIIVTNDSGLMHTAAAMHIPVLVLFGSSVKEFGFIPYKTKYKILENNLLSCRPCSHIGKEKCPKKHFKCMKDLTPDIVYENLIEMVNTL